jgi:hypothetical protein
MDLLGIDGRGDSVKHQRNWKGVRSFFQSKLVELKSVKESKLEDDSDENKLYASVLEEALEAVQRQLGQMSYFQSDEQVKTSMDEERLQYAPLTNLGCEGEFAKLDNRISQSGGSTTVKTLSQKNVVTTNRLLVDQTFTSLSDKEKSDKWKWSRTSDQVSDVKEIEANYLLTVKMSRRLAVAKKEELKKKKQARTSKLLDTCKDHGGPVTPKSLALVDSLNEKQLIAEIGYLRVTIAPNIRQMRRIKVDGKLKNVTLPLQELRQSIKNAVQPESEISNDIDTLLKKYL